MVEEQEDVRNSASSENVRFPNTDGDHQSALAWSRSVALNPHLHPLRRSRALLVVLAISGRSVVILNSTLGHKNA